MESDEGAPAAPDSAREPSTRLNRLADPGGGGGPAPDLASSSAEKRAAAGAIEQRIRPAAGRAGRGTAASMAAAAREFAPRDGEGWDTHTALGKTQETWNKQVGMLLGRLAAEAGILRATAVDLRSDDHGIGLRVSGSSALDQY
jgi:hypothetical protein